MPVPPSITASQQPTASPSPTTPVVTAPARQLATSAPPPPANGNPAATAKQCSYITLDEFGQAAGTELTWTMRPAVKDECYYETVNMPINDSIEVVVDPPGTIGQIAGSSSVSGLGAAAYWTAKYGVLLVRMPKHDFAVYFTAAPNFMNESAATLKSQALKVFAFAKPRLK